MAKTKVPQPNLRTPEDQLGAGERVKAASNMVRGHLREDFSDTGRDQIDEESEALAKSHGIYMEYNRAKTGREKDWMYMVRMSIPGGGPLRREQWAILDELSEKYTTDNDGRPSLRPTTRQNIQFHWVKKPHLIEIVRDIARTGFFTMNGCGDNVRNTMGCPLSRYNDLFDATRIAHQFGEYFRLPAEAHIQVFAVDPNHVRTPEEHFAYGDKLLNRKFKMAIAALVRNPRTGAVEPDNCVECRTNEVGICPIWNPKSGKVDRFMIFIGGGQGEKNGKPTFATLGEPFGVTDEANLLKVVDSIVHVQQDWGDRQNRHWARMKYVVLEKGIPWFQQQVRERGGSFEDPIPDFDPGPRMLHHGWHELNNGKLAFGAYVECGRIINGPNGRLKSMVRYIMDHFDGLELMVSPNQDLLFCNLPPEARDPFEATLQEYGHGVRHGKPVSTLRVLSGACVGLYTCRLSYTESEQFEPELIDQLETMGYGDVHESIGITGCERQCFRPATKTIGWIGQGPNLYALKLGGSEDARHQGHYLTDGERWYLRQVPRDQVALVTAVLFDLYAERGGKYPDVGAFLRALGDAAIIEHLRDNPQTAHLMEKTAEAPFRPAAQRADSFAI